MVLISCHCGVCRLVKWFTVLFSLWGWRIGPDITCKWNGQTFSPNLGSSSSVVFIILHNICNLWSIHWQVTSVPIPRLASLQIAQLQTFQSEVLVVMDNDLPTSTCTQQQWVHAHNGKTQTSIMSTDPDKHSIQMWWNSIVVCVIKLHRTYVVVGQGAVPNLYLNELAAHYCVWYVERKLTICGCSAFIGHPQLVLACAWSSYNPAPFVGHSVVVFVFFAWSHDPI